MLAATEEPAGMLDVRGIELRKVCGPEVPEIREPVVDLFRLNPDVGDEDTHSLLAFAVLGPAMVTASPVNSKASGYAFSLENHTL